MKAPLSWVKEYITTKTSPDKLAEELLLSGTKVEEIKKVDQELVFDFEITPNRADTLSMVGIAREIASIEQKSLTLPSTDLLLPPKKAVGKVPFKVVNKNLCPNYSIVKITGIEIGQSPKWMRDFLILAGVRPINNVVDITNFVMLELGQPMHAFDYAKISGGLTLRAAKNGEKITTLDGQERVLPEGAIIIEDKEKIVDLAGLMGGKNSEVDEKTREIILLVPLYDPVQIRKASLFTNLRTEASNRFEKKLDPNLHHFAMDRSVKLFSELAEGQLGSQIFSTPKIAPKTILLEKKMVPKVIGTTLTDEEINDLLSAAGFFVNDSRLKDDTFEIQVPTFRRDVEIAEDLLEEIARLYGYNKLPKTLPAKAIPVTKETFEQDTESKVRDYLLRVGFSELTGYTLISKTDCLDFGFDPEKCLKVANPASSDFEYLRPSLLINSVKALSVNRDRTELSFFEIGKIFEKKINKDTSLPNQPQKLGLITNNPLDEFKGKLGQLWEIFDLNIQEKVAQEKESIFESHLEFYQKGERVGQLGKLSQEIKEKFELKGDFYSCEIDSSLFETAGNLKYKQQPKFPGIKEDFSFYLPKETLVGQVISKIKNLDLLIYSVDLKDIYEIEGKRSVTLAIEFLDPKKTLENKEIEKLREKLTKFLEVAFKAIFRKK